MRRSGFRTLGITAESASDAVLERLEKGFDATKIREELGWEPEHGWREGLAETVAWYRESRAWWEPLKARAPVEETAAWR